MRNRDPKYQSEQICSLTIRPKELTKTTQEIETQTRDIVTKDQKLDTYQPSEDVGEQCDLEIRPFAQEDQYDVNALNRFLRSRVPLFLNAINETSILQMHGSLFQSSQGQANQSSMQEILRVPISDKMAQNQYYMSELTFNNNGYLVAAGVSTHKKDVTEQSQSFICAWYSQRNRLDPLKPDILYNIGQSVTSLAFHPKKSTVLAVGTFSGKIYIYDLQNEEKKALIAQSEMNELFHMEPVTGLQWCPQRINNRGQYTLASVSMDGKMLIWEEAKQINMTYPIRGYYLDRRISPGKTAISCCSAFLQLKQARNKFVVGTMNGQLLLLELEHRLEYGGKRPVTLMKWDETTFIIMSNILNGGGGTSSQNFKSVKKYVEDLLQTRDEKEVTIDTLLQAGPQVHRQLYRNPVTNQYDEHFGQILQMEFNPATQNYFLTVSSDNSLRVYNVESNEPVLNMSFPGQNINSACWLELNPNMIALGYDNGNVQIYDLSEDIDEPVINIDLGEFGINAGVAKLAYNSKSQVLAIGSLAGDVALYSISSTFGKQKFELDLRFG